MGILGDMSMHLGRPLARGEHSAARRANLSTGLARLSASLRALGPYVALALTLPGGSLIALTMLAVRHRGALPPLRGVILAVIVAASIVLRGST